MQRQKPLLILIFVLVFAAIAVLVNFNVPLGLDLRGGSQLTIQVKTTEKIKQVSEQDLEAFKQFWEIESMVLVFPNQSYSRSEIIKS